jgi:cytidylate kinase
MTVITISREFGAGGLSAATLLAEHLGLEVVDRSIVEDLVGRLHVSPTDVERADEHPASLVDRILDQFRYLDPPELAAAWQPPYPDAAFDPRQSIVSGTEQLIRDAARHGQVVIVGRGAAFLLRDHPGALHVFLHASGDRRVRAVQERLAVSADEAKRRVHETDANRAAYIRQLYHADWHDLTRYHLAIDTGRTGIAGAVGLIEAALGAPAGGA